MNNIQSFINQQLGFAKWGHYDMALKRLTCRKEEEFTSLLPHNDPSELSNPDPPIFACKFAHVKVWTPLGISIEIIKVDPSFWNEDMLPKLKTFYLSRLRPEIIDPRYPRQLSILEAPTIGI